MNWTEFPTEFQHKLVSKNFKKLLNHHEKSYGYYEIVNKIKH